MKISFGGGIDEHNERVAEFYGYDSYRDMLIADGVDVDLWDKIKSGEVKTTEITLKELVKTIELQKEKDNE